MKKRLTSLALAMLMLVCVFAGCSQQQSQDSSQSQDPSPAPVQTASGDVAQSAVAQGSDDEVVDASRDTLTMTVDREPASLDPAVYVSTYNAHDQIYEGLIAYDVDGNFVPSLAKSWEQVDDVTWKFYLRDDVYFHNGEHFTAADCVYSFKRAMTFPQAATYFKYFDPESFEALDDYTFTFKTTEPYAFTLACLCDYFGYIVNQKAIEDAGSDEAYGRNPVGTGAYKFVKWVAADSITLERFDDYWGEPAKIKNVVFKYVIEPTTRTIDLESGGSDINWVVANEDYERVANGENTVVYKYSIGAWRYLPLNVTKQPLDDIRVRQALQYATDSQTIWQVVFGPDVADYSTSVIAPGLDGHVDEPGYTYDPEKAKALLAEAGYADGLTIEFLELSNAVEDMIVTLLKEQWAAVGVNLIISPIDSAGINSKLNAGDFYVSSLQMKTVPIDAGYIMWKMFHSSNCGSSNRSYIRNDELDAILDKICVTGDKAERDKLAIQAQAIVNEQATVINLCHLHALNGLSSKLRGYEASGFRRPLLKTCYFVEG
ncbi:MAG: ABC transporter substrate-binding protein [Eubacteriales bacterium]|nr:ABC transporter substrate-binding protein [Eubacteriales bacterium]